MLVCTHQGQHHNTIQVQKCSPAGAVAMVMGYVCIRVDSVFFYIALLSEHVGQTYIGTTLRGVLL